MPITVGSNIASLRSQRQLFRTSNELESVFTRLSSGQRINRASDDAAGLAIADSLRSDARVFTQGVRNLNDGISILNVADGALQELTNITFRLAELAEQAANGTLGVQQRAALDEEAQALSDEYFRIVQSTEFNDRQLFTADFGQLQLQAGFGTDAILGQGLGGAIGTGNFDSFVSFDAEDSGPNDVVTGDFNGDGFLDLASANRNGDSISVLLGLGDGSFGAANTFSVGDTPRSLETADFNNDGILDLVSVDSVDETVSILLGRGDGSFEQANTFAVGGQPRDVAIGDFNGDGVFDLATADAQDDAVSILIGNGDGTFNARTSIDVVSNDPRSLRVGDFNNDGISDFVTTNIGDDEISIVLGVGDGTFQVETTTFAGDAVRSADIGDFDGDGVLDLITANSTDSTLSVLIGNGDGTFSTPQITAIDDDPISVRTADFNGDGVLDIVNRQDLAIGLLLGRGDGTFEDEILIEASTSPVPLGSDPALNFGDFNNDGVLDLVATDSFGIQLNVLIAQTTDGISPLLDFSLNSIADARQALSQFSQSLNRLSAQRGQIGAFQSRIEVAENVLQVTAENFQAAESRIRDADIAQEAANLVRLQILQQSSTSILSQANLQPQLALQLLGSIN